MQQEDKEYLQQYVDQRMGSCRADVDKEIKSVSTDMHQLKVEVHGLRQDMHKITASVGDMSQSLREIAANVGKLSDLHDTWQKVKGFWSVMTWLRGNILPMTTLVVLLLYIAVNSSAIEFIQSLVP
jgi:small-conductance mechanosensitive channel